MDLNKNNNNNKKFCPKNKQALLNVLEVFSK